MTSEDALLDEVSTLLAESYMKNVFLPSEKRMLENWDEEWAKYDKQQAELAKYREESNAAD